MLGLLPVPQQLRRHAGDDRIVGDVLRHDRARADDRPLADEVLSIPMYPELTDEQIDRVATAIREFTKTR